MNKIANGKIVWRIIVLTIIFICSVQISYARYIKTETIKGIQEIARPILTVEEGKKVLINEKNNVGYYEFSIKNYNEKYVSEIGFLYNIQIISKIGEIVKFELYNQEGMVELKNLRTEQILIKGKEKIEQKYKLKIIYNKEAFCEKSILEKIQIKVNSEQEKL